MTRAEQAALKAYPVEMEYRPTRDVNEFNRGIYEEGYEQAEKDTITRACNVLKLFFPQNMTLFEKSDYNDLIKDFRTALEIDNGEV